MIRSISALCALFALTACSQQIDVGEKEIALVDKAELASQLLYLDLAVSPQPLTAEQLGDTRFATPVRVEFFNQWVIAWWAPEGEAVRGVPENAMGVWWVESHENWQPLEGTVDNQPGEGNTIATPESPATVAPQTIPVQGFTVPVTNLNTRLDEDHYLPLAKINWLRERVDEWRALPPTFHPGCD